MKFLKNWEKNRRNLKEIEKKILNDSMKIMETLLGKVEVIRNWCWYYEEILKSFSKIISVKLGKNYEEILEKIWKNIGNILHKFSYKHFDGNFVKFSRQFLEELMKICMEISNNFGKKLRRNSENILEIFGALLKIWPGVFQRGV